MWKYFRNFTGDTGKFHGALNEAEARRIHDGGGMYALAKTGHLESGRAIVVNTSSPFVSIKETDERLQCRFSWNFGRGTDAEILNFAQGFYFFCENDTGYRVKLTATMTLEGKIYLETRNRLSGKVTENNFFPEIAPKPLHLPSFGDYQEIYSYEDRFLSGFVDRTGGHQDSSGNLQR